MPARPSYDPTRRGGSNSSAGRPVRRPSRGHSSSSSSRPSSARSPLETALDAAAEIAAPETVPTFAELGLPKSLVSALERQGKTAPFAIQVRALPDALAGKDVLGRGQTGSGKTLAFGLPVLARLAGGERKRSQPRALVLVPTRELAQQVHDELAPLAQGLDLKLTTVYGGASMGRQIDHLRRGVDLVVATPGRLKDLIEQRECDLSQIEITVLDEADHMADLGFLPAVTELLDMTPATGQRLLFSATLDRGVDKLVHGFLKDPALHAVASAASPVDSMDHKVFAVTHSMKADIAAEIAARPARTLFFVRTKHGADRLATQLRMVGVEAAAIHGNLTQNARKRALDDFTTGHTRVLVATDVAARGIHVNDVDLVVHFDPPADHKDYLHRSGRTARAGARGTVLSLILGDQVRDHQRLRERAGVEANAVSVTPGHPAVREVAESGEVIVVQPRIASSGARRSTSPGGAGRPRRSAPPSGARPAYRGGSASSSSSEGGSSASYQGSRPASGGGYEGSRPAATGGSTTSRPASGGGYSGGPRSG
ncbi:MAG: box helicase protein, partial [Frankiales bacterium]|nr:box helicase protein [Frankiales bacterium]